MGRQFRVISAAALAAVLGAGVLPAAAADWDDGYRDWGPERRWDDEDGGRRGWGDRRGWDNGGDAAAAALGGFALGATAGAMAQPPYGGCYIVQRPVVDAWGDVMDYRSVEVCE
ncbi:hypothetical protein [Methylocystis echinoides]|jgi:hypothetical protein|uniref:hypothetical protein n=1 Tax=Methylocystis echinoides TaxID=29468 RepID=UPI00341A8E3E